MLKHINIMIDNKAMVIGESNVAEFDKFMLGAFEMAHKEKKEQTKVEVIATLRRLVEEFYSQMVKESEDHMVRLEKARKITFLPALNEQMIVYLTDYFDNVREQAQNLVMDVVKNFIPFNPQFSASQEESLDMLRANV